MKKLFNTRDRMPDDMIDGLIAAFPSLVARGRHPRLVRQANPSPGKVALVIGQWLRP